MSDEIMAGNGFSTFETQDRVLVGLSGGVDSTMCVRILQQQGFDVRAAVIRFSPAHDAAVAAAARVAAQLGVPLTVEDCTEAFEREVIAPFCDAYCRGVTPCPCVMCNPLVKFRALAAAADREGIHYLASGHYARIAEENGHYYVQKAVSAARDQSYMLYRLPQDILARLCLPIGEFEKPDIRAMAAGENLASADAPDSQEICFIPDGDYAAYIAARGGHSAQGRFVGPHGEDLGPHRGVEHYTVGQRKGLGIAYGEPLFVREIGADGSVQLALGGGEYAQGVVLTDVTRPDGGAFLPGETYDVKVRSRAVCAPCTVSVQPDGALALHFAAPQRAPAPGQSAVLYRGDLVLGGGVIESVLW